MLGIDRLPDVFVEVADTLVDDFDVIDFLRMVAERAAEVTGETAVGMMLSDYDGQLRFMAATSESVELLELFQLQTAQGPCLDCHRLGRPVSHTDLRLAEPRWPLFARRAVSLGFLSVHAFPMRLRDRVIGAMNVFGANPSPLASPDAPRVLQALADVATIGIIQERAVAQAETLTEQLQGALNSRIVIEQAKGAVARTFGVGVDEAFDLIRGHARSHNIKLTDFAAGLVTNPAALDLFVEARRDHDLPPNAGA